VSGTLTIDEQDSWPARHLITVTGLGDTTFTINRIVGGARTPVRAALDVYIYPTTSYVVVDAEAPFGVPMTYELVEDGVAGDTDGPHTLTLVGGNAAITDAITGLAAEVQVGAVDALERDANASVYNVDGINRVVSSLLGQAQTTLEVLTTTVAARDQLRAVLAGCTSGVIQLRGPDPAYDADAYYAVLSTAERRYSQDGTDPRRITAVRVAETTGWPTGLEAAGYTYADVAAAYAGLTYADLATDFATYLDLARGDFG
jgi:hypothetical protein